MVRIGLVLLALGVCCLLASGAFATPDFVQHVPGNGVYGETADVTMREQLAPREDEPVDLWVKVGYSGYYTDVAIYYTTDGADPAGSYGAAGNGSTSVLRSSAGQISFVRNESGNIDWWKATLPSSTRTYGLTIKYKIGVWHSGGGAEIFANNTGCADGTCDDPSAPATIFSYTVKLAWPGKGYPNSSPNAGYPNVHFWKEEAVVGNNNMNVMLDMNGSIYDVYYPSAGCAEGMGTKNEGYVDGNDTFPPGLPLGYRGQMNMNTAFAGLRVNGTTYWLTNEGGAYNKISQSYVTNTNVVKSTQTLSISGNNIKVEQYDFCPKGTDYPTGDGGIPLKGIHIKRVLLTNNGTAAKTLNFYYYADPALNGGDNFDTMSFDPARGSMSMNDFTYRTTSSSGEYNPTSFPDYTKNVSVSLVSALKQCTPGEAIGTVATDSWKDSSTDDGQGWIGLKITLNPGETREVDICTVGGFKQSAGDAGTPSIYNGQIAPALGWFQARSAANLQSTTENYWTNWLSSGTTINFPDAEYNTVFKRSLLATALHLDEKGGGVIAGMHNGAYPFIWPRDAVYAAVTLDRTGHQTEAEDVYRFLRDVAYRANEEPGRKGFWYQKYTTDGYMVWTAPQVDETAVVPWGVRYHYDSTGNTGFLTANYQMVYEAARASSEDSAINSALYYDDSNKLMHSNNVWEDSWDDFLYSNASVERGLRDAAVIASATGHPADSALFTSRANDIHTGILGRLDWDGENVDISMLGITYPFESLSANDPRMLHVLDRINGTAADRWGNRHSIVNTYGEFSGLVNRYYNDSYWRGGPWFLSTLWYGQFFAEQQESLGGKAKVDVLKSKLDLLLNRLGPMGLGAEQIAPSTSLLYGGQADFSLQAAWPNAWESMSTIVDSMMLFLDFRPDAGGNRFSISPKLPTAWSTITLNNLRVGSRTFNVTCSESASDGRQVFTNVNGGAVGFDTVIRIPAGVNPMSVTRDQAPVPYTVDMATGQVRVSGALNSGVGSTTTIRVYLATTAEVTMQQVKSAAVGTKGYLSGVVTRVHSDRFNVENTDRTCGVAVMGTGAARGKAAKLYGSVGISGAERVFVAEDLFEQTDAAEVPKPVMMIGKSAGGSKSGLQEGASGASGLNNIGLDVVLVGTIREMAGDGSYIVIDDGSGLTSRTGAAGIRIVGDLGTSRFIEGQMVRAEGSMSIDEYGGVHYPMLRVAKAEDVR